ncbi:MAG: hypothetical protein IJK68_08035 [Muribaculaceae bacterium]|nr:hypothetical protein [Muribaculaceae bacterium]MBR0024475.1 hypothetical protein [Muribaculaceae bacterium]
MKKITLLILAGLVAMIAQAGVINSDKAAKLQNAKANVIVKAEGDIVTPPAGAEQMLYNFQGHDTYIDQDKTFEVFVVIDNNDIYVKGFSEYLTEGWVKGTIADGVATFPAAFMGVFEFWGDAYDLDFDGAVFTVSDDASELFAADGYTTSADGEVLDEFINVTLTKAQPEIATPATPTITEFTEDDYGHYVKMTIPAKDVDGNDLFAALLSYQLLVDHNGEQSVYEFTTDDYLFLEENMTVVPYNFTDYYDIDVAGKQVYIYGDDIDEWNAIGVKSIYTVGDKSRETRESEIFWYQLKPTAINGISTNNVVETNYYDLQGRKVDASATGLLIKQMRMQDGTVRAVKVLR